MSGHHHHHHHRMVTVASVVLLCLLQSSRAMPDFGINANINSGRSDVVAEAQRLGNEFATVNSLTVQLEAGYWLLGSVQDDITSIGGQFEAAGSAIAQQLRSLAMDNGPNNVNAVFGAVYGAVDALQTLMSTGLTQELGELNDLTGPFIPGKFSDVFDAMRTVLVALVDKLHTLQDGVAAARAAAGGMGSVSASIIRTRVPIRMQNAVVNAIVDVRSRIGAVRYMVSTTLRDLDLADEFLEDVTEEAQDEVADMQQDTLAEFTEAVADRRDQVLHHVQVSVSCVVASQLPDLDGVLGELSSLSSFATDLGAPLAGLLSSFELASLSAQADSVNSFVEGYMSAAYSLQGDLSTFFKETTCGVVHDTMLVLVAGGPYNRFCFYKYSDRVYSLYREYVDSVSKCYEVEYQRVETLARALLELVDLILFDVEDVVFRLAVCVDLQTNNEGCVSALGGYYLALAEQSLEKVAVWMGLLEHELNASYSRLQACVRSNEYVHYRAVRVIRFNLERCSVRGPQPYNTDDSNETSELPMV